MEILKNYSTEIIGALTFVIGLVVPVVVAKGKVVLEFIKSKIGDANYEECKKFLIGIAELHPEDFAEDKIVGLLDALDNKFGDHLNKTQIKEIVDFVAKTIVSDVAKVASVDASKITAGVVNTGTIAAGETLASTVATPVK